MKSHVIVSSPDILSGTPVFAGTCVPIKNLFEYLETGVTLEEFLITFPSVKQEQALEVLALDEESLTRHERDSSPR